MNDNDTNFMSNGQQVTLLTAQALANAISVFGSVSIIVIVYQSKRGWKNLTSGLYHRIMLGLSFYDIVFSLNFAIAPYLQLPAVRLLGAVGNTGTCSTSGFFNMAALGGVMYNCNLSFYYHQTIVFNVSDKQMVKRYEPWMHGVPFLFWILYGTVNAALKNFNPWETLRICGIKPYPADCGMDGDLTDCERGEHAPKTGYIKPAVVALSSLLSIIFTLRVYLSVRNTFAASRRHLANSVSKSYSNNVVNQESKGENPDKSPKGLSPENPNSMTSAISTKQAIESKTSNHTKQKLQFRDATENEAVSSSQTVLARSGKNKTTDRQAERLRTVMWQAILYCSFFIGAVVVMMIMMIVEDVAMVPRDELGHPGWFLLILVETVFVALCGFFNFAIYIRPRYVRWKRAGFSTIESLREIYKGNTAPQRRTPSKSTNTPRRAADSSTIHGKTSTSYNFNEETDNAENEHEQHHDEGTSEEPISSTKIHVGFSSFNFQDDEPTETISE